MSVSCWDCFGGYLQGWNKSKWVYRETDRRYYGLCIVSLCASRPFCLPSFGGPQGVFREIVAMGYRHSMSVCHTPIGSGRHRLGHVLDLWWYGYGSLMMLSCLPLFCLCVPVSSPRLSFSLSIRRQLEREGDRRRWKGAGELSVRRVMGQRCLRMCRHESVGFYLITCGARR